MIFQVHDQHGKHIAYTSLEADSNRKRGWRDVTKEEFYGTNVPRQSLPAVETGPIETAGQEAAPQDVPVVKKRGRKVNGHGA